MSEIRGTFLGSLLQGGSSWAFEGPLFSQTPLGRLLTLSNFELPYLGFTKFGARGTLRTLLVIWGSMLGFPYFSKMTLRPSKNLPK